MLTQVLATTIAFAVAATPAVARAQPAGGSEPVAGTPRGARPATPAPAKVAVLELHDGAAVGDAAVRFLAEQVRGAALGLPADAWFVMTRENLVALLPPGTDLAQCAADCEIETGRSIGADYIVTGEVTRLGSQLKLGLKAHQVATGRLVAQASASAETVEGLEPTLGPAANHLFARLAGPNVEAAPAVLSIRGPGRLVVHIDGVEVGALPLSDRRVGAGRHDITVEGACHARISTPVEVVAGERRQIDLKPPLKRATLKVEALDEAGGPTPAKVYVDGKAVGDAPGQFEVPACAERVEVSNGQGTWKDTLSLSEGATHGLTATLGTGGAAGFNRPVTIASRESAISSAAWWYTAGGLGGIALGAVMAYSNQRDGELLQQTPDDLALRERVDQSHQASITFYVLGGIALGIGVSAFLVGVLSDPPNESAAEAPALAPRPAARSAPPGPALRWGVGPGAVGLEGTF